jgi:putative membrane protein
MLSVLPTISTFFIVVSAVFVAFGWRAILQGRRETHRKLMVTGAIFALAFFTVYMSRTIFVGNTTFSHNSPAAVRDAYYIFLLFHITLATVSAVFGIITLLHAYNKRFAKHKKIGRWTAVMWLITAPTGVAVYVLLYILYPGGATKPMIDAILGG